MQAATRNKLLRFGLLLLLLAGLYAVGSATGLLEAVDLEWIRSRVEAAGAWGVLAYLGIFCVAVLLWIPGLIFALAGVVIYGPWLGPPLALLGLALSSSIMVTVFRRVGGELLLDLERPLLQRALARLHDQPVRSVALLRLFLLVNPPLNTALAMAGVRFRHNFLGTALGMAPFCIVMAVAVEPLVRWVTGG
jgi:uncharacterized membrane protein YdjX (TVP38/TMEM64 family)